MPRAFDGPARWGWVSRALHWTMAALILFQLGFGLYMTQFVPDVLARFTLTQVHKSWGFVVFVLALVRVGWRLANRTRPALPATMPAWQVRAAGLSHVALYALMLLMPLSGWLLASASPVQDLLQMQNMVFGAFALPDPVVPGNEAIEAAARLVHVSGAIALAAILAVHAGAALRHHLVERRRRADPDDPRRLRQTKTAPRVGRGVRPKGRRQTVSGVFRLDMNWSNSDRSLAARSCSRNFRNASRSSSSRFSVSSR